MHQLQVACAELQSLHETRVIALSFFLPMPWELMDWEFQDFGACAVGFLLVHIVCKWMSNVLRIERVFQALRPLFYEDKSAV